LTPSFTQDATLASLKNRKRPTDRGFYVPLAHEIVCPVEGLVQAGEPENKTYLEKAQKPKVLLVAIVVVGSVVGISGIYRQVIDPEWVQHSPTHLPKMSLSTSTIKRSAIVAAIYRRLSQSRPARPGSRLHASRPRLNCRNRALRLLP
jgi:hypothetical protein